MALWGGKKRYRCCRYMYLPATFWLLSPAADVNGSSGQALRPSFYIWGIFAACSGRVTPLKKVATNAVLLFIGMCIYLFLYTYIFFRLWRLLWFVEIHVNATVTLSKHTNFPMFIIAPSTMIIRHYFDFCVSLWPANVLNCFVVKNVFL